MRVLARFDLYLVVSNTTENRTDSAEYLLRLAEFWLIWRPQLYVCFCSESSIQTENSSWSKPPTIFPSGQRNRRTAWTGYVAGKTNNLSLAPGRSANDGTVSFIGLSSPRSSACYQYCRPTVECNTAAFWNTSGHGCRSRNPFHASSDPRTSSYPRTHPPTYWQVSRSFPCPSLRVRVHAKHLLGFHRRCTICVTPDVPRKWRPAFTGPTCTFPLELQRFSNPTQPWSHPLSTPFVREMPPSYRWYPRSHFRSLAWPVNKIRLVFLPIGDPRYALLSSRNSCLDLGQLYKMPVRHAGPS